MRYSCVIPCYNEAGNLEALITAIESALALNPDLAMEFILVDNGSNDGSYERLQQLCNGHTVRFVQVTTNKGYGYGILMGLVATKGEILGWTHADLQTDLNDVIKGFRLYESEAEPVVVKGHRRNRRLVEKLFSVGMEVFCWWHLGCYLTDINAQPKVFSRAFYESVKDKAPYDFSLDLYWLLTAKQQDFKLLSFSVVFGKRTQGEAKGGGSFKTRIKLIRRTVAYVLAMKQHMRKTQKGR